MKVGGTRLERFRVERGLTKGQLATLLRLIPQTLSHTQNRAKTDPPFSVVAGYCSRLMISLDWLVGFDVPMWSRPICYEWREKALSELQRIRVVTYEERMSKILRVFNDLDSQQFTPLFLAAIVRMCSSVDTLLTPLAFPPGAGEELIECFGLQRKWLTTGKGPVV